MAYMSKLSLIALLVLFAISRHAIAGRQIPMKTNQIPENTKDVDLKQSKFLFKSLHDKYHDNSFLIPGIGRVMVPPAFSVPSYGPHRGIGGIGGIGGSIPGTGGSIPGGDDAFIPGGGSVPAPAHP
ncbi:hypothetical protein P3X46_019047 [Hevea brasiliensis]|uniref:Cell wall protein n=1 Tax=Hevea brasiliensis TaxID=3981 RepID=A0ABQ9LSP7_HEVBR|nr:putative cell wall protein [Hevea brasiliensis]KAJ9170992.1 hypothetical protein P3X46_019047 [Hevea brasiliensis]